MDSRLQKVVDKIESEIEDKLYPREYAYLEQIKSPADVGNFDHNDDTLRSLVYSVAIAMGLSKQEAERLYTPPLPPAQTTTQAKKPTVITSGLGIGGHGSDDHHIGMYADVGPGYVQGNAQPGSQVCPAGTTDGHAGGENDYCHCGKHGDWNPGAGQILCTRHWDEY